MENLKIKIGESLENIQVNIHKEGKHIVISFTESLEYKTIKVDIPDEFVDWVNKKTIVYGALIDLEKIYNDFISYTNFNWMQRRRFYRIFNEYCDRHNLEFSDKRVNGIKYIIINKKYNPF